MRYFNTKNLIILIVLLLVLIIPYVVFADEPGPPTITDYDPDDPYFNPPGDAGEKAQSKLRDIAGKTYGDTITESALGDVSARVINGFLAILGIIFLSYMIYGGYLRLTAGGSEEKVTKANTTIRNGIIGVIIVIAAYAITYFVLSYALGIDDGGGLKGRTGR